MSVSELEAENQQGQRQEIKHFDKTGIFQQIVQADSVEELADLEARVELIDAIQRATLLQSLPQTALYFLEKELSFARHKTGDGIHQLAPGQEKISNMFLVVEGQAMVLGREPGTTQERVINVLKKGEFFFDKSFKWAGAYASQVQALIPTDVLQIPFSTLGKIVKVSAGVRKRLKAISLRVDKRAEGFGGEVGKIYNFLTQKGLSYSERVRVIRLDKCIDCDACYEGCEARHGASRIWRSPSSYGLLNFPDACRTCEFQHCLGRCAGEHIAFDEHFREVIVKDTCTGCTHCEDDCPFGVIKMIERKPDVVRPMLRLKTLDPIGDLSPRDVEDELKKEFRRKGETDEDGNPLSKEAKREAKQKAKEAKKKEKEAAAQARAEGKKAAPRKKPKVKQIAIKCDHCIGYSDLACVSACPTGAIFDISQRELFERLDLYGTVSGAQVEVREIRPQVHEKLVVGRGALHALMWAMALLVAAGLGWESWALSSAPELSFTHLWHTITGAALPVDGLARLESGDGTGHALGWIGASLLAGALMYVPKKRIAFLRSIGSKAGDLDVHVLFGLLGAVFAVYHTTFKLSATIIEPFIAFCAITVVLITGVIGRYFYSKVPRTIAGNELQLQDLQDEAFELEQRVSRALSDPEPFKAHLQDMGVPVHVREKGLMRVVVAMFAADFRRRGKLRKIRKLLRHDANMTRVEAKETLQTIRSLEVLKQNVLLLEKSKKISRLWHVVHITAAIIMIPALLYHIYIGFTFQV